MNAYSMMIVPLFSGSGMRVKILEGMALGKVVVTTTLGKEGIHAEHQEHLLVADTPEAFIQHISAMLDGTVDAQVLGVQAKRFVENAYDHQTNAHRLLEKYRSLKASPEYQKSL